MGDRICEHVSPASDKATVQILMRKNREVNDRCVELYRQIEQTDKLLAQITALLTKHFSEDNE